MLKRFLFGLIFAGAVVAVPAAAPLAPLAAGTAPRVAPAPLPLPDGIGEQAARRLVLALTLLQDAPKVDPLPDPKMPKGRTFKRGLRPTPAHKLLAAKKFVPRAGPLPAVVAYVPKTLRMWGNDQYGDCVSAEEAAKLAAQGIFLDNQTVIDWADKHGFLNGADLAEVLDAMKSDGMVFGGKKYGDGNKATVDYSNEATLQAALSLSPVKIAIDASALPSGAGNNQGWYSFGKGRYPNTDHCVGLMGYGSADALFKALGVALPSGVDPAKPCYLLFTWSTIGVVDHDWLMGTCTEAWTREPATTVDGQPIPDPGPSPNPPANAYTLWEGPKQVGAASYGDLAQAVAAGQNLANADKVSVDVKDGAGKVVQTLQPNPNPPTPPTPVGPGFTGSVTYTYANGTLVTVSTGTTALEAELKQAGVSPNIVTDVAQLVADLKAKAGLATLLRDALRITEDLLTNATPDQRKDLPQALAPTRMNRLPRRGRRTSDLTPSAF